MYKQIKELLEKSGIELSDGLKESEIGKIEQIYEFKFPKSLRDFLSYTLPISVEFYNWRDFSDENIKEIKQAMNYVFEYLKNDPIDEIFPNEGYWNTQKWGPMPEDGSRKRAVVLEAAKIAPKIIPVYSHRYMPCLKLPDPPVLSIHYTDVICYGENLYDYFLREFSKKSFDPIGKFPQVPFWSDLY